MKFYVALASAIAARNACGDYHQVAVAIDWTRYIATLVQDHAPQGEGFTVGTWLDELATNIGGSKPQRLVFRTALHMIEYRVWVYPWFDGLDIRVVGRDSCGSKQYLADMFYSMAAHDAMSFADYRNGVTS